MTNTYERTHKEVLAEMLKAFEGTEKYSEYEQHVSAFMKMLSKKPSATKQAEVTAENHDLMEAIASALSENSPMTADMIASSAPVKAIAMARHATLGYSGSKVRSVINSYMANTVRKAEKVKGVTRVMYELIPAETADPEGEDSDAE